MNYSAAPYWSLIHQLEMEGENASPQWRIEHAGSHASWRYHVHPKIKKTKNETRFSVTCNWFEYQSADWSSIINNKIFKKKQNKLALRGIELGTETGTTNIRALKLIVTCEFNRFFILHSWLWRLIKGHLFFFDNKKLLSNMNHKLRDEELHLYQQMTRIH